MSNINFFRVLQSSGIGGSSGGEIDWDDFTLSSHFTSSVNSSDLDVKSDQTEIFLAPYNTKRIDVYDFDTTGDISGGITFSTTGTTLNKYFGGFQFNPTGTKVFALMRNSLAGVTTGIYQYNLTTAWDTSTMSSTEDEYVAFSTLNSNISTVTSRAFTIDEDGLNINNRNFVGYIIKKEPNHLSNFINLGHQSYLCQNVCHVLRDHEAKEKFIGPRFMIRLASLEMHPMDDADRIPEIKNDYGSGMCNITRCCTEVCPEDIQITDDGIIPLKERVVDRYFDPFMILFRKLFKK